MIKPVVNYFGSKRRIAPKLAEIIRPHLTGKNTYYEPFVGGGSVYLALEYPDSVIGDIVPDLINMYECIRDDYERVIEHYNRLQGTETEYLRIREMDRDPHYKEMDRFFRAARFIYLSRRGFGGIRYNKAGYVNMPFNKHPERKYRAQEKDMREMSRLLETTRIINGDYTETLSTVKEGDFVYLDPPYYDKFTQYWKTGYTFDDLKKLKAHCDKLNDMGVKFMLSHSYNGLARELYNEYNRLTVDILRDIFWQDEGRNKRDDELVITNFYVR